MHLRVIGHCNYLIEAKTETKDARIVKPGQEFDVEDGLGKRLLAAHPDAFAKAVPAEKPKPAPAKDEHKEEHHEEHKEEEKPKPAQGKKQ